MSSKSSAPASASSAKLAKVRSDRDAFFSAGKFYEALQLYKTLVSRARMKREWGMACDTATEGAEALLARGQAGAGGELALALLEIYTKSGAKAGEKEIRTILELATAFPSAAPAASASPAAAAAASPAASSTPVESTPFESKIAFLRAALKWSQAVAPPGAVAGSGHPDIHLALARTLRSIPTQAGEDPSAGFAAAHQQYLRSGGATALSQLTRLNPSASAAQEWKAGVEYEEDCELLCAWAGAGSPSEMDLFFARAALQYLCVEDIAGCTAVLAWLKQHKPAVADQPLIHFAGFLSEVVQRGGPNAGRLFDLLRSRYSPVLDRDPNLDSYLDKIGEVYLGRVAQKGFMETLMSGMGATQHAAAAAPQSSPSPAPAAAVAAAASFDAPMASDVD